MTDFTTDAPFVRSRGAASPRRDHHSMPPKREYHAYFAIIFLAALPLATLTWALGGLRRLEWPTKGPLSRAWSQARIITPMIFSA